jgi:leader peptidase (prepilin peptidase) / N-methyltransferase
MTQLLELFVENNTLFLSLIALFALCLGSLLNVIIYRVPLMLIEEWKTHCHQLMESDKTPCSKRNLNLFVPRSFCPNCKKTIRMWQNIPILSYLLLGGKCFYCKTKISYRYPLIEFLTVILTVIVALKFGVSWPLLFALIFTFWLIALSFIDIDHQLLPDSLTLSLLWIGLLVNTWDTFTPLSNAVLSACGAYISLWLFIKLFYLVTGKIGMGHGDFKLFAAFGAWFGWQSLPFILITSSLLGAILGIIILKFTKQSNQTPIPFGPFLCLAGWFYLIMGNEIMQWYWGLY